jgi:cytoskeleton protein RodZ
MHIAALAVSLKVPVKKLEALEQNRFDLLPDSVFVRALASSVCRTLKLDAAAVLERFAPDQCAQADLPGLGHQCAVSLARRGPSPSVWTQVSKQAVLAGLPFAVGRPGADFHAGCQTGRQQWQKRSRWHAALR